MYVKQFILVSFYDWSYLRKKLTVKNRQLFCRKLPVCDFTNLKQICELNLMKTNKLVERSCEKRSIKWPHAPTFSICARLRITEINFSRHTVYYLFICKYNHQ